MAQHATSWADSATCRYMWLLCFLSAGLFALLLLATPYSNIYYCVILTMLLETGLVYRRKRREQRRIISRPSCWFTGAMVDVMMADTERCTQMSDTFMQLSIGLLWRWWGVTPTKCVASCSSCLHSANTICAVPTSFLPVTSAYLLLRPQVLLFWWPRDHRLR